MTDPSQSPLSGIVAAIDPGRSKCGLVLADCSRGEVHEACVVDAKTTVAQLESWQRRHAINTLVIGNGTSSQHWQQLLQHLAPLRVVDEAGTTLRARDRFWQIWPARGWRRCLPQGLRLPPCELDAIAALVLLEDQLGHPLRWHNPPPGGPSFRNGLEP